MRFFITGITGTLGQAVSKILLRDPKNRVVGYSRDEQKQRQITPHENLTLYIGDVRDRDRLIEATRDCDVILHFAALKCVDTLEHQADEALKTNTLGTENVLHAQRVNRVWRTVLTSTDKAVYPINAYGYSKALAEKLVLQNKNNVVVRYGNVLASRGSVIPMFVKTIQESKTVHITDLNMTRFFMRIEDAALFVINRAFYSEGGVDIYKDMKAVTVLELANTVGLILGVPKPTVLVTGIRPGEKIHEALVAEHEGKLLTSENASRYSREELLKLLTPIVNGLRKVKSNQRMKSVEITA